MPLLPRIEKAIASCFHTIHDLETIIEIYTCASMLIEDSENTEDAQLNKSQLRQNLMKGATTWIEIFLHLPLTNISNTFDEINIRKEKCDEQLTNDIVSIALKYVREIFPGLRLNLLILTANEVKKQQDNFKINIMLLYEEKEDIESIKKAFLILHFILLYSRTHCFMHPKDVSNFLDLNDNEQYKYGLDSNSQKKNLSSKVMSKIEFAKKTKVSKINKYNSNLFRALLFSQYYAANQIDENPLNPTRPKIAQKLLYCSLAEISRSYREITFLMIFKASLFKEKQTLYFAMLINQLKFLKKELKLSNLEKTARLIVKIDKCITTPDLILEVKLFLDDFINFLPSLKVEKSSSQIETPLMINEKASVLGIPSDDLKDYANRGGYFVDKSLFIKHILNSHLKIHIFSVPSGFGKSTNLNMLFEYLRPHKARTERLFAHLAISKDEESQKKHGNFRVLFIHFPGHTNAKFDSSFFLNIKKAIIKSLKQLAQDSKSLDAQEFCQQLIENKENIDENNIQQIISKFNNLITKDSREDLYLLIDDFDLPTKNCAGETNSIILFLKRLFSAFENASVKIVIMTEKRSIYKYNILPSFIQPSKAELNECLAFFGFNEAEIKTIPGIDGSVPKDYLPSLCKAHDYVGESVERQFSSRIVAHRWITGNFDGKFHAAPFLPVMYNGVSKKSLKKDSVKNSPSFSFSQPSSPALYSGHVRTRSGDEKALTDLTESSFHVSRRASK